MNIFKQFSRGPAVIHGIEELKKQYNFFITEREKLSELMKSDKQHFKIIKNKLVTSTEYEINRKVILEYKNFVEMLDAILYQVEK